MSVSPTVSPADLALGEVRHRELGDVVLPKIRFEAITVMAGERLHVQSAVRVLGMSESGYYE